MQAVASKWVISYNLLKNWVFWGDNPFSNHLSSLWDVQVRRPKLSHEYSFLMILLQSPHSQDFFSADRTALSPAVDQVCPTLGLGAVCCAGALNRTLLM